MGNVSKRNKKVKQGNRQLLKILMPKKKQKETVEKKTRRTGKRPGQSCTCPRLYSKKRSQTGNLNSSVKGVSAINLAGEYTKGRKQKGN